MMSQGYRPYKHEPMVLFWGQSNKGAGGIYCINAMGQILNRLKMNRFPSVQTTLAPRIRCFELYDWFSIR